VSSAAAEAGYSPKWPVAEILAVPYFNDRPLKWRLRARWTAAVFGPRKVRTP